MLCSDKFCAPTLRPTLFLINDVLGKNLERSEKMPASTNGATQYQDEGLHGESDDWIILLRRPVRREGSSQYVVFVLVSFAVSVSVTRLFLSLSGYPQIGNGELHIAHVLWGGLLLFIAAILPLLISDRRIYKAAAILAGVGIGLFIDEVGKFITQRNDYFYPAAAPIIYIFFMLTLMLLLQMRRQDRSSARAELSRVLETLQDWIYYPLNKKEQAVLLERLKNIRARAKSDILTGLTNSILTVVQQDSRPAPIERSPRWEIYIKGLDRWISEHGLRVSLAIGFLIMSIVAFKNPLGAFLNSRFPSFWGSKLIGTQLGRWYGSETAPDLYQLRVILEIALGFLLLADSLFLFYKKRRIGIPLGFGILLFYLAAIDILLFYFEQFSTLIFVIFQCLLLIGLMYYRTRFASEARERVSNR